MPALSVPIRFAIGVLLLAMSRFGNADGSKVPSKVDGEGWVSLISRTPPPGVSGLEPRGDMTFYYGRSKLGACGKPVEDSNFHCALPGSVFDPNTPGKNPNVNSLCGRRVCLHSQKTGKNSWCEARDRCPPDECKAGDIDVTMAVFQSLGHELDEGRVPVVWWYCDTPYPGTASAATAATVCAALGCVALVLFAVWLVARRRRGKIAGLPRSKSSTLEMDEDKDVKPEAALANSFTSPIARPSLYSLEDDAWKTAEDLPTMGRMSGSMLPGLVGRVSLSQAD